MGTASHKRNAPLYVQVGILTLSSTRNLSEDLSGQWIKEEAEKLGHTVVCHQVSDDNVEEIVTAVTKIIDSFSPRLLLLNGGTGIAMKDVTVEAVRPLFQKELTAFGALFAKLSFEEIGSAAILSRAAAGIIRQTAVFCMPGSLKACQLACRRLIFPEMGHITKHIQKG